MRKLFKIFMISLPFLLSASSSEVKIYKGTSSYTSDILYTVRDKKVYDRTSSYSSDVIFTIRDGKAYKGNSSYTSDVAYTLRNGRVYKGTSSWSSDIVAHFDGNLTLPEYIAVLHTILYVY